MKAKKKYEKKIKVNCGKCHKWIDETEVIFVNIEEDFEGADMLTFKCPFCKTEQKSRRFG
jgi:endogenous inhibitor of DNA gyrase (YacG/DUF329 family)